MKNITIVLILICLTSYVEAKELQLFNTAVLGQSTKTAVKLLNDKKSDDVAPLTVMVDVKDGKYYASTIQYPKELSFEEARASLNKLYKNHEKKEFKNPSITMWRNEEHRFTIQLSQDEDVIRVIYIQFLPNEEFIKRLLKFMGENPNEKFKHKEKGINK